MDEEGRRNDILNFCIIVAKDYLLQIDVTSSHILIGVLGVDDIGDTLFSFPIVSSEHNLSNPFDINIEKIGLCLIVFMAEIRHIDNHNLLLFITHIVVFCYSSLTQRRSLCEIGFIECGHFSTDIADSEIQRSYMWLKVSNICRSLFISFNDNTVPIRKSNCITLLYWIESSEVNKVSILHSIKVFMKNIRFLPQSFVFNPNWLSSGRDYNDKQADN